MNILGISCFYHDSAAALIKDGKVAAAVQEERFNRVKNSSDFPIHAINYCLQAGGITPDDLDYIAFYEKPFLKFSRVIISHLRSYPFSLKNFLATVPQWLQDRLIIPLVLKKEIGFRGKVLFIKHHLSHAASAFLVSPFEEAAIITADGVGEWATTTCGHARGNDIKILKEIHFPDSLGLLYAAVTSYLGFAANRDEGKVMGLASYGEPRYLDKFKEIITVLPDGSFRMDSSFFGFNRGSRMYSAKFLKTFGEERQMGAGTEIDQRHCDLAASLQKFIEDTLLLIANNLHRETRMDNICLAGGLFLNCVANNRILEETPFKNIFIQPAAGDSGGALGAAVYTCHSLLNLPRKYVLNEAYLGPAFSANQIKRSLLNHNLDFRQLDDDALIEYAAGKLAASNIVGWFQGRLEFGPRALGNRSILANPANPEMKDLLNERVKKRESFRPYAPAVLEERAGEYFELGNPSPFMLLAPRVKEGKEKIIPAVTHVDGTARVQTVSKSTNPRFWNLINELGKITGIPVVLNTSFNLRGEPIVCSPEEAISCFERSRMDYLVLENFVVGKNN